MEYNNPNDPWMYDPYKGLDDDERMKAGCLQLVSYLIMIFIGLLLCALLGSCKSVEYVPSLRRTSPTVMIIDTAIPVGSSRAFLFKIEMLNLKS